MLCKLHEPFCKDLTVRFADYLKVISISKPGIFASKSIKHESANKRNDVAKTEASMRKLIHGTTAYWALFGVQVELAVLCDNAGSLAKSAARSIPSFVCGGLSFNVLNLQVTSSLLERLLVKLNECVEQHLVGDQYTFNIRAARGRLSLNIFCEVYDRLFKHRAKLDDVESQLMPDKVIQYGLEYALVIALSTCIYLKHRYLDPSPEQLPKPPRL